MSCVELTWMRILGEIRWFGQIRRSNGVAKRPFLLDSCADRRWNGALSRLDSYHRPLWLAAAEGHGLRL